MYLSETLNFLGKETATSPSITSLMLPVALPVTDAVAVQGAQTSLPGTEVLEQSVAARILSVPYSCSSICNMSIFSFVAFCLASRGECRTELGAAPGGSGGIF